MRTCASGDSMLPICLASLAALRIFATSRASRPSFMSAIRSRTSAPIAWTAFTSSDATRPVSTKHCTRVTLALRLKSSQSLRASSDARSRSGAPISGQSSPNAVGVQTAVTRERAFERTLIACSYSAASVMVRSVSHFVLRPASVSWSVSRVAPRVVDVALHAGIQRDKQAGA